MPKLEQFDPSRPLVASTFFRLGGQIYRKGDAVLYSEQHDRVLRRLHDLRRIKHSTEDGNEPDVRSPRETLMAGNAERRQQIKDSNARAAGVLSPTEPTADELEAVQKLVDGNTQAQLLEKAEGLEGITAKSKKADIALAILRSDRGTA